MIAVENVEERKEGFAGLLRGLGKKSLYLWLGVSCFVYGLSSLSILKANMTGLSLVVRYGFRVNESQKGLRCC